jgi:hypothetical protein
MIMNTFYTWGELATAVGVDLIDLVGEDPLEFEVGNPAEPGPALSLRVDAEKLYVRVSGDNGLVWKSITFDE